jgi:hypothetical protein
MDVRITPTKKWLKHINLEHLAEVFESNGFETVGAIIAMDPGDVKVIFQPNGPELGERRLLEQQIRMLKTKVSFCQVFSDKFFFSLLEKRLFSTFPLLIAMQ